MKAASFSSGVGMSYELLARIAEARGLALRGGFHPAPDDHVPDLPDQTPPGTLLMLGWTGSRQWPVFAASAEYGDGASHPLDRWSRRIIGAMAHEFGGIALYPFGGPPHRPFLRWAQRAEALSPSPLGLLVHPDWGLWHAWRGALALSTRLRLPPPDTRLSPCSACPTQPCRRPRDFEAARAACPVGTPYSPCQDAFHRKAAGR